MFRRADSVDDGYQKSKAGLERTDVATESLDRPFVSLRHRFDGHPDEDHCEHDDKDDEDAKGAEHGTVPAIISMSGR